MKNILAFIGFLVILGGVGYWYLTRPVTSPSTITTNDTTLETSDGPQYHINQDNSTVSFSIKEILRGNPFTAVGTTSAISGAVAFDGKNLSFGTIQVNARTLKTDDSRRDGALARLILKSENDANEFIVFRPTGTNKIPKTIPKGTPFTFSLLGDLTISGITKPISFDVTMTLTDTIITADIASILKRSDFSLTVPNLPFIASVDDEVAITGTVVANRTK